MFTLALLATLATSWNVVLVSQYDRMLEMGHSLKSGNAPWLKIILGTAGFIALVVASTSLYIKSQKEMRTSFIQREFLAKLSHELKSPLSTLELTSSLLKDPKTLENQEETRTLWEAHDAELTRLKNEVSLLLEAARWDHGIAKPKLREQNLEALLSETLDYWSTALGSQHELLRKGDSLNGKVLIDVKLFQLILNNLIDNARKYSPVGTPIILVTKLRENQWSISVIDSGCGIAPANFKKVFKRFYTNNQNHKVKQAGTGLGLYLAKRAADALKLKLQIHSSSKEGTRFDVSGNLA